VIHLARPGSDAIRTARLLLRDFRPGDWRAVQRYASDPEVVRYLVWGPNTEDQTRAFVSRAVVQSRRRPRTQYELAVTLASTGDLIGAIAVRLEDRAHAIGSMGYAFSRDAWGQGFATEAARAMVAVGFARLGLHRLWAMCVSENAGSRRVLEKIGMQYEGHLHENYLIRGVRYDSLLYAALRPLEIRRGSTAK